MERLTERNKYGGAYYPYCFRDDTCDGSGASHECNNCDFATKACEKLAHYEDLEEQGLLKRFPCKINDAIYTIVLGKIEKYIVSGFSVLENNILIRLEYEYKKHTYHTTTELSKLGKSWFLTKAEAENALEEIKEKEKIK